MKTTSGTAYIIFIYFYRNVSEQID